MASQGNPWQYGTSNMAAASIVVPAVDPDWGGSAGLQAEHYRHCISCRIVTRGTKTKSLNKVQDVKEKPNEDPSEFQQRVFKAHRQYIESCSPRELKGS